MATEGLFEEVTSELKPAWQVGVVGQARRLLPGSWWSWAEVQRWQIEFQYNWCHSLNCNPPKMLKSYSPVPVNVILFGNRLFADDQEEVIWVGPNPTQQISIKRRNLDIETCTQKERHLKTKADWSDASTSHGMPKVASKPPETGREAWNTLPLTALGRNQLCQYLDLGPLVSRTARQHISVV